jgi:hypothetical protein
VITVWIVFGESQVIDGPARLSPANGGRSWWAHFEFTRINIEPIILRKKIEDLRGVGASSRLAARRQRHGLVR